MGTVTINGNTITVPDGETINITSKDGNISINANQVYSVTQNDNKRVTIEVKGVSVGSVKADASVHCENVEGNVTAGSSVHAGDVGGNVTAGSSIKCGKVNGKAHAGSSIQIINNG